MILGLGIGGEAGEVCDEIKKLFRDSDGKINEAWREQDGPGIGGRAVVCVSDCGDCRSKTLDMVAQRNIGQDKGGEDCAGCR